MHSQSCAHPHHPLCCSVNDRSACAAQLEPPVCPYHKMEHEKPSDPLAHPCPHPLPLTLHPATPTPQSQNAGALTSHPSPLRPSPSLTPRPAPSPFPCPPSPGKLTAARALPPLLLLAGQLPAGPSRRQTSSPPYMPAESPPLPAARCGRGIEGHRIGRKTSQAF